MKEKLEQPAQAEAPSAGPAHIKKINMGDLGRLGVDSKRRLYWDGKEIQVTKRLEFSKLQKAFGWVVALGTIIGGLGAGLNNGFEFGCKLKWWSQGCFLSKIQDK